MNIEELKQKEKALDEQIAAQTELKLTRESIARKQKQLNELKRQNDPLRRFLRI